MVSVAVVGLGYVGSVTAASLAASGVRVVGIDRRQDVVDAMSRGVPPVAEPELRERLQRAAELGTLSCTTSLEAAGSCDATLICVGTPVGADGQLVTKDVLDVLVGVGAATTAGKPHHLVIRSTVPPGLYREALAALSFLGDALGDRVTLSLNPEFLREGSAVADLEAPELIVYASDHDGAEEFFGTLYAANRDRLRRTDPSSAEVLKLVNNAWHALKVAFANEVARTTLPIGVDPFAVMALLCADTKLNTSAAYLRPGLPFGGACLVKDVASLETHAAKYAVAAPLLGSILRSNDAHLQYLVDVVLAHRPKSAAIVGVGFKPGAADVRDSAPVRLVRALLDAGVHVTVADSAVLDATVPPLGLDALRAALGDPRAQAAPSVAHAIAGADVVVVGHPSAEDRRALVALKPTVPLLDAAGELSRKLSESDRESLAPVIVLVPGARR